MDNGVLLILLTLFRIVAKLPDSTTSVLNSRPSALRLTLGKSVALRELVVITDFLPSALISTAFLGVGASCTALAASLVGLASVGTSSALIASTGF